MRRWILALLLVFGVARFAAADGEIVFSARFYNPPAKAKEPSYWHLYRCNPDGTGRKQVTNGAFDDTSPHWSPDGRFVAFLRAAAASRQGRDEGNDAPPALCLLDTATGKVRVLQRFPKWAKLSERPGGVWSPDSALIAVNVYSGNESVLEVISARSGTSAQHFTGSEELQWGVDAKRAILDRGAILDMATGKKTPLPGDTADPCWQVAGGIIAATNKAPSALVFMGNDGSETRRLPIKDLPKEALDEGVSEVAVYPPAPGKFALYATLGGESTGGHFNNYVRVDLASGEADSFTAGKFLSWSPDRSRFCTLISRDLADYGKRSDGKAASVWTQPLLAGDGKTGKTHEIVGGLVYVVGADWRPKDGAK